MAARTRSRLAIASMSVLGALTTLGCQPGSINSDDFGKMIGSSAGAAWVVYPDPYAGTPMAGAPNPISTTITGTVTAWDMGGKLRLQLVVSGLPPARAFGSHLHKLACDDTKAGGHYEDNMWPAGSNANDPTYANKDNEAWLDFTTDDTGKASPETTQNWLPRAGQAKSIIIHHMATLPGGVAGAKLACLPITF